MHGSDLIKAIRKQYSDDTGESGTDLQIANHLGVTIPTLKNWAASEDMKPYQIARLISRVGQAAKAEVKLSIVKPVVEFYQINRVPAGKAGYAVFGVMNEDGVTHPYLSGLRKELDSNSGVYIFYDSRGRALYVGKARKQTLWKEINLVYNRPRKAQIIRRVDHPERRQDFRTSDEIRRQIRRRVVRLFDISEYFSAYAVDDTSVDNIEALLMRGFPNDILNSRMENFT